jgi:hypothetical protein
LKLNGLDGVISQKMILFMTTAVKTSNPTFFWLVQRDPDILEEHIVSIFRTKE